MSLTESFPVTSDNSRRFRWRRLLQFRLRTLLILTTMIAIWLAWWSYSARQQRAAVAEIRAVGGYVEYDFEEHDLSGPSGWPSWLVEALGMDYFASVQSVGLRMQRRNSVRSTDASLEHLNGLATLETLYLDCTSVTDSGLEQLHGRTSLKKLSLAYTGVTDAGLEHVKKLAGLQELDLSYTEVTDAGLEHLRGSSSLLVLHVGATRVTDTGIARLRKVLPNCQISR